jgi:selenide,water dikinase
LAQVLRRLPHPSDPAVLVGIATSDDAGVYRLTDELALVQTVDFFTPIVDDPFNFGRIAAANSLSDIYAMGARPLTALNIVAFPIETLGVEVLGEILAGGAAVAQEAGVVILGGHTVKDDEPKYGMAVTGTAHPERLITNAGAEAGDLLFLTKPLGTGILATALKRGAIDEAAMAPAVRSMAQLNAVAGRTMVEAGAHAATDVTGYGLLGHGAEMARASGVRLRLHASCVPILDGVLELIERGFVPGGTRENASAHAGFTSFADDVPPALRLALSDAQTSGGLLIAVPPGERAAHLREALRAGGALAAEIGTVEAGEGLAVNR